MLNDFFAGDIIAKSFSLVSLISIDTEQLIQFPKYLAFLQVFPVFDIQAKPKPVATEVKIVPPICRADQPDLGKRGSSATVRTTRHPYADLFIDKLVFGQ